MSSKPIHRKRTVEIYFILYLASLLFLLPDGKNKDLHQGSGDRFVAELPFNIYPEKTNLTARLHSDSLGIKILTLDSCNNIFYSGEVKNVKYEFTVYDAMMKQSLQIRPDIGTKYYRIIENTKNKSVAFYWEPTQSEQGNKSYIVQVSATAEPVNGVTNILYQAKTQFSLNILFNDKKNTGNSFNTTSNPNPFDYNAFIDSLRRAETIRITQTGDFDLSPEKELIQQLAYQKWVNTINVYNIDLFKELKSKPQIIVSGDANQSYKDVNSEISRDRIVLSGATPPSGRVTVKVVLDRKIDSKQKSISFSVKPVPYESAQYEKTMYINKTYSIDPKFPLLEKETRAELKLGNQIIARSPQGTKFQFTPDKSMIGKSLELERYIDNSLIPEENRILIADYPLPEIISIQEINSNEVEVKTKTYGSIGNEKNIITHFEINGNANYRELVGRMDESKDNFSRIQVFRFTAKKSGLALEFTFTAIDKSGKKSRSRSYSGE